MNPESFAPQGQTSVLLRAGYIVQDFLRLDTK